MPTSSQPMKVLSAILTAAGALFLISSFIPGLYLNLAWPAIFFVGAAAVFILLAYVRGYSPWLALLYIPGVMLLAAGLLFLYNTISQDWNAWVYAWLFLVAALGLGILLSAREIKLTGPWERNLPRTGFWLASGGLSLFTILALIIGGPGIRAFAALIVIAAGVLLYYHMTYGALPAVVTRLLTEYGLLPQPQEPESSAASPLLDSTDLRAANNALIEPLSERELEVLRLIALGHSNNEIADHLVVAPSTVKTHINNLYAKLDVKTRVQAVNRAKELRLL